MVVFADLGKLSDKSVRRVVTGIDPSIVALALVGTPPELRETVLAAVSKRLRGIIEGEAEAVVDRPAKDVEAARRVLERAMFQLHTRGELVPRAA
jgi:flagellar motor switch protein FliG